MHYLDELWIPEGFDRQNWDKWQAGGAKSMFDWARDKKQDILANHHPEPVEPALASEIDKIVAAARKEMLGA